MKTIEAFEFEDFDLALQCGIIDEERDNEVKFQLDALHNDFNAGKITEEEYYKNLGCSKSYAETTPWFIHSCYYEANQETIDENVHKQVRMRLYNEAGTVIGTVDEAL